MILCFEKTDAIIFIQLHFINIYQDKHNKN